MTQRTIHGSLDNLTDDQVRISLDPRVWANNWLALRDALAEQASPVFNRWTADAPVCA